MEKTELERLKRMWNETLTNAILANDARTIYRARERLEELQSEVEE